MRVLLADDQPKVRAALRLILEQLKKVEIIEEVVDAKSLIDRLEGSNPDLLLLDWELPGLQPGLSFNELRSHNQDLKVIVLSARISNDQFAPFQSNPPCGADAFISKCDPPERLFATLHAFGTD